jgi:acetoin utilization deacetylase AcuC-like enzyme
MKIFYTDHFVLPLPPEHRFPMDKYRRLRERVVAADLAGEALCVPHAATDQELFRAHDVEYVRRVVQGELTPAEVRRIGFPWSLEMVERSRRSSGATIEAARSALDSGVGINLAGGTHHAFADAGEGYCVFNDSVVAARALQAEGLVQKVVVLDLDVHQGNGTASICREDPSIFTMSVHGARNFPLRKETSDLDIALEDGATDEPFLEAVERGVRLGLERSSADLAIYLAGADPFEGDAFGRLKVSKKGLAERDKIVWEAINRAGLPVAISMAGGYARNIDDIVDIHFHTVELFSRSGKPKKS